MQVSPLSPSPPVLALFTFLVHAHHPRVAIWDDGAKAVSTGTGPQQIFIDQLGSLFVCFQ